MRTGLKLPTYSLADFILTYYGDVKYIPYYLESTGTNYDDFITGTTEELYLPDLSVVTTSIDDDVIFEDETERIPVRKNYRQTLYDVTLEKYGDISKVMDNLNDANVNNISLYRDNMSYDKTDILKNKLTEEYKRLGVEIATGTRMIEILPQGEVFDTLGDFTDDFNIDFDI